LVDNVTRGCQGMENGQEITDIAAQRVIERINEQPNLAIAVLTELREVPKYSSSAANQIEQDHGFEGREFYQFLGEVIANRDLYLEIDIGEAAINVAAQDPAMNQIARNLEIKASILTEEAKEKINQAKEQLTLSKRANELLALARIIVSFSQISDQEDSRIRA